MKATKHLTDGRLNRRSGPELTAAMKRRRIQLVNIDTLNSRWMKAVHRAITWHQAPKLSTAVSVLSVVLWRVRRLKYEPRALALT